MTDYEIEKIKEHIAIHFAKEPRSVRITAILNKAVEELEWHFVKGGVLSRQGRFVPSLLGRWRHNGK